MENELYNESLEQRVEKLEYYMRIMREYVRDTEVFDFWDWIMNNGLDEYEVKQILTVTKTYNERFKNDNDVKFDEYYCEIKDIMINNIKLRKYINRVFVKQMLISLRKLMFKKLIDKLLNEENEETKKG